MKNTFVHTLDIANALRTAILALALPSSFSAVPDYPKAFTTVAVWRQQSLREALEELLLHDDRVCLIIPGGDTHDHSIAGTNLVAKRQTEFHLLIADRSFARGNVPLVGDDKAPGVIALKDVVLDGLTGVNLGFNFIALAPTSGEPFHLTDRERQNDPGRDCWAQTFTTYAGAASVSIR